VLHSSNHLLKLINDVLELARFELGDFSCEPAAVDAARVASEVCDALATLAVSKQQRIRIEPDDLGELWVDPRLLKQLVYQFLSNAIRFTPDEGMITLRLRRDGADHFCLEVEDTGAGIKPEDLDRLFQPFQKLEGRTHRGGSGLGLALAKRVAETLNGSVSVTSVVGKGSVFSARLPRRSASSTRLRAQGRPSGTGA
jgi:signal transduction histidine kinase